jgi:glycosyltransferase involved in cell wall biosynthesis
LVNPDAALKKRGVVIIGYIGVIAFQDGLDYLLRALQLLKIELGREGFFCVIIGSGSALDEMKAKASVLGLEEHTLFTGFISDVDTLNRYLSSIDIGTDPAPSNELNDRSTMIKMMEYMALRKPIVAFDLPEHRVSSAGAALYARPNDELDFARQISVLMDDPERRVKMGQIGRERVERELAWPFQEKHLLAAYESIAATRDPLRSALG